MNKDVELAHQAGVLGGFKDLHPDMVEFVKLIRADEREQCADIAENWRCNGMPRYGVAEAIRARGQG